MNRSSRFLAASLALVTVAACDEVPDAAAPTTPVSSNAVGAPDERIGPGVLEMIRAGGGVATPALISGEIQYNTSAASSVRPACM